MSHIDRLREQLSAELRGWLSAELRGWPERWVMDIGQDEEWLGTWSTCTKDGDVQEVSGDPDEDYALDFARVVALLFNLTPGLLTEVAALKLRQQELLQTIVRVTNETPFADEVNDWMAQRARMITEIGTLKAQVAELERRLDHD